MKATTSEEKQERWDAAVRQYAQSWRRNNPTADQSALQAYRDEAEQFFELNVPKEARQATGKNFDDFFSELDKQIEWA